VHPCQLRQPPMRRPPAETLRTRAVKSSSLRKLSANRRKKPRRPETGVNPSNSRALTAE